MDTGHNKGQTGLQMTEMVKWAEIKDADNVYVQAAINKQRF